MVEWHYVQDVKSDKVEKFCEEAMKKHPELDLISSGMAVVDARNELIGVRGFSERGRSILKFERMAKASPLKVSFAPAMIRMDAAQEAAFDPNLRRSEDADYLIQILTRHKYGALTDVNYVYRFMSFEKVDLLAGYISRIQVLKKYRESNLFLGLLQLLLPGLALVAIFGVGAAPPMAVYALPGVGVLVAIRDLFGSGVAPGVLALAVVAAAAYAIVFVLLAAYVFSREWALMRGV